MDVDLGRRTLDGVSSFLVSGHADEVSTVEDTIDPGDAKIATVLMPSRARRQRLAVDLPRVLDPRTRLRLASQTYRRSLGDRVLAGAHGEVKVAVLAEHRRRYCEKERETEWIQSRNNRANKDAQYRCVITDLKEDKGFYDGGMITRRFQCVRETCTNFIFKNL